MRPRLWSIARPAEKHHIPPSPRAACMSDHDLLDDDVELDDLRLRYLYDEYLLQRGA